MDYQAIPNDEEVQKHPKKRIEWKSKNQVNFKKIENICNAIIIVLLVLVLMLFIAMVLDMIGVLKITSMYSYVWSPRLTQTSLAQKNTQMDKLNQIMTQNQVLEEQNQQILQQQQQLEQQESYLEEQLDSFKNAQINPQEIAPSLLLEKFNVEKPQVDSKDYRYFTLENKLKIMLIQDKEANMGQAALCVGAGSWSEPDEYPGLAHFLEHMLFQGSFTYPESGMFQQMVAKAGGSTNAYTRAEETNYYFKISNENMKEALQVFSHFFIDPLLNEDMVNKEANAVHSEYEIAVSNDGWKILHLLNRISKDSHPMSRFTIGNLDSLQKEDILTALRKFHDDYYSANQMALVIKSNMDLDELEKWIKDESDFVQIENKEMQKLDYGKFGMPIDKENLGSIIKYHINGNTKIVLFTYQLEGTISSYRSKPLTFINSIVKSKHDKGLYSYLTDQGLALDVDADTLLEGNGAFVFYLIQVSLPNDANRSTILQISQAISSYFDTMIADFFDEIDQENIGASKYLEQLWNQEKQLSLTQFKFLEDTDYSPLNSVFKLSHNLLAYDPQHMLSADFLYESYNPELIYNYLADLINPMNLVVLVGDKEFKLDENEIVKATSLLQKISSDDNEFLNNNIVNHHSDLYRLDYSFKPLTEQSLEYIAQGIQNNNIKFEDTTNISAQDDDTKFQFMLPPINDFIPDSFKIKSLCQEKYKNRRSTIKKRQTFKKQKATTDPYEFMQVDSFDEDKRLSMFMDNTPLVFQSREDCIKHEMEYESMNVFPHLIKKDLEGRVWWKLQRSYKIPSIYSGIKFDSPNSYKSVREQALLSLFNSYMNDKLKQDMQSALEAGYKFSFGTSRSGIFIELYGWTQNYEQFYTTILNSIHESKIDDTSRFQRVVNNMKLSYSNVYQGKLFGQALSSYLPNAMILDSYDPTSFTNELETIELQDVIDFKNQVLKNFRFTAFYTGNLVRQDVDNYVQKLQHIFHTSTNHIHIDKHSYQVVRLRGKSIVLPYISKSGDVNDQNGVTLNYYQIGYRDRKTYAIMQLLSGTFQNRAFTYLRTELQLGYVVSAGFRPQGCIDGAMIIVQGTVEAPYKVNQHIEVFLKLFGEELNDMSDEQLESLKQGAKSKLEQKITSLVDEGQFLWDHIKFGDLAFEEKEVAAQLIEQITKEDILAFYDKVFKQEDTGKLSLQIYGQALIDKKMQATNEQDWLHQIKENVLTDSQTYVGRNEEIATDESILHSKTAYPYSCGYQLSNI